MYAPGPFSLPLVGYGIQPSGAFVDCNLLFIPRKRSYEAMPTKANTGPILITVYIVIFIMYFTARRIGRVKGLDLSLAFKDIQPA